MSAKTVEQQINEYCDQIKSEIARWKHINECGCNDPFWPDGCNMNLVRNHIIYYRGKIEELCMEHGVTLPPEYYLPVPKEVSSKYIAHYNQKERVQRLQQTGTKLVCKRNEYDDYQLSFF